MEIVWWVDVGGRRGRTPRPFISPGESAENRQKSPKITVPKEPARDARGTPRLSAKAMRGYIETQNALLIAENCQKIAQVSENRVF